jgi:hypothetical protein
MSSLTYLALAESVWRFAAFLHPLFAFLGVGDGIAIAAVCATLTSALIAATVVLLRAYFPGKVLATEEHTLESCPQQTRLAVLETKQDSVEASLGEIKTGMDKGFGEVRASFREVHKRMDHVLSNGKVGAE